MLGPGLLADGRGNRGGSPSVRILSRFVILIGEVFFLLFVGTGIYILRCEHNWRRGRDWCVSLSRSERFRSDKAQSHSMINYEIDQGLQIFHVHGKCWMTTIFFRLEKLRYFTCGIFFCRFSSNEITVGIAYPSNFQISVHEFLGLYLLFLNNRNTHL